MELALLMFALPLVLLGAGGGGDSEDTDDDSRQIEGTEAADAIRDDSGEDLTVDALGGDDTISTGAGDDTIEAGAGDDHLSGGAGQNSLSGGAGNDVLDGADSTLGADHLDGGAGDDTILAAGDDTIATGAGADLISLGSQPDAEDSEPLVSVSHLTVRDFTPGEDHLEIDMSGTVGGVAHSAGVLGLREEDGNTIVTLLDPLTGVSQDAVTLIGVTGTTLADLVPDYAGPDTVDGTDGADDLMLANHWEAVFVDGGAGNDSIELGGGADIALGGAGADAISGNYGADTLLGGAGNDRLLAGYFDDMAGDLPFDVPEYGLETEDMHDDDLPDYLDGGAGDDTIYGGSGGESAIDTLIGGDGDDVIADIPGWTNTYEGISSTHDSAALIDGGTGNDTIFVSGNDTVTTGEGGDLIEMGSLYDSDLYTSPVEWRLETPAVLTSLVTITDFTPGEDLLHIDLDQVESVIDHETQTVPDVTTTTYDLHLREEDGNTIVSVGLPGGIFTDAVVLQGVTGVRLADILAEPEAAAA